MRAFFSRRASSVYLTFFILIVFASCASAQNMFRKVSDFDGDGKTDYAVVRGENGSMIWYIWQSSAGFKAIQWGLASDLPVAADYDGDGKTDIASYRKSLDSGSGRYSFYILQSQSGSLAVKTIEHPQGIPPDLPLQQDYNGDGKTDAAVYFQPTFVSGFIRYKTVDGGADVERNALLSDGERALKIGDMSGDGHADRAALNPANNSVTLSDINTPSGARTIHFGAPGDVYVPADFDGDGIGDLTIWRSSDGTWWWMKSTDNTINAATFGASGDVPVPADYDGDGKTDLAIWRGGTQSYYWVYGSQNGVSVFAWGTSTDSAVTY